MGFKINRLVAYKTYQMNIQFLVSYIFHKACKLKFTGSFCFPTFKMSSAYLLPALLRINMPISLYVKKRSAIRNVIITLFLIFTCSISNAQQIAAYNHYFYNPMIYNPAFTGYNNSLNVMLINRTQWAGFKGSPKLSIFEIDGNLAPQKTAVGLTLISDKKGISNRTEAHVSYSYRISINDKSQLRFGLSLGYINQTLDFAKGIIENANDPILFTDIQRQSAFNGNAGLALVFNKLELSASAPKILGTKIKYLDDENIRLYYSQAPHYTSSLKYKIFIAKEKGLSIAPQVLIRFIKNTPLQYDANINLEWKNKFWIGATYKNNYAVAANVGFCLFKRLSLGYSYDYMVGNIANYAGMSHEIMINFRFLERENTTNEKENKKNNKKNNKNNSSTINSEKKQVKTLQSKLEKTEKEIEKLDAKLKKQTVKDTKINKDNEIKENKIKENKIKEEEIKEEEIKEEEIKDPEIKEAEIKDSEIAEAEIADADIADTESPAEETSVDDGKSELNDLLLQKLIEKIANLLDKTQTTREEIQELRNEIAAFLDSDFSDPAAQGALKKEYDKLNKTKDIVNVMVSGVIILEKAKSKFDYSSIELTITDKETSEIIGSYKPNPKTGKYLFILSPNKNYSIKAESAGFQKYEEDYFTDDSDETYEITKDILLKKQK